MGKVIEVEMEQTILALQVRLIAIPQYRILFHEQEMSSSDFQS